MCGIAGIVNFSDNQHISADLLQEMYSTIQHRGPDNFGYHLDPHGRFGVLNARLSIVDRAGGDQPIYRKSRTLGIVYNGELYNYQELRSSLMSRGYDFHTDTDTEVILAAFEAEREDSFSALNGMFAFCIWDDITGEIFLVRDGLGMKPLYVHQSSEKLLFSSELRTLISLSDVDLTPCPLGLQDYFTFRYIQAPYTLYQDIFRLEAGTYLRIRGDSVARYRHYELPQNEEPLTSTPRTDSYYLSELSSLFEETVKSHLMGEVPIGVLLSGGIDSSLIAAFVKKCGANLTTFNIGFPDLNEFRFSREVAKHLDLPHVEIELDFNEFIENFPTIMLAMDEPIADPACFPLFRLCRAISEEVTVVLSGEGGDEVFGGYPQYLRSLQSNLPSLERYQQFLDFSYYFRDGSRFLRHQTSPHSVLRCRKFFDEEDRLNGMLAHDLRTWMPENLMAKADKITMSYSLEGRFPFLDKNMIAFARRLPPHLKIGADGGTKVILRELAKELIPSSVITRPKMGFSVPIDKLLYHLKKEVFASIDTLEASSLNNVFHLPRIRREAHRYFKGEQISPLSVWTNFIFCYWHAFTREQIHSRVSLFESVKARSFEDRKIAVGQ